MFRLRRVSVAKRITPKKTPSKKVAPKKAVAKKTAAKKTAPKEAAAGSPIEQSAPKTTRADTSDRRDPPEATGIVIKAAVEHGSDTTTFGESVVAATPAASGKKKGSIPERTRDAMPNRIDIH